MNVVCNPDGTQVIHASAKEAALLAGRTEFGDLSKLQAKLQDLMADAWYAADCPPWKP